MSDTEPSSGNSLYESESEQEGGFFFGGTEGKKQSGKSRKTSKSRKIKKSRKSKSVFELKDNLRNSGIRRVARQAGVKALSSLVYDECRKHMEDFVTLLVRKAVIYAEYNRRRTVKQDDVLSVLESHNLRMYVTGHEGELQRCESYKSKTGKSRKSKRGNLALREIKHAQKQHDCVFFSRSGVYRVVKSIIDDCKFSSNAMGTIQVALEKYLVELLSRANLCAIHAGRETVQPKDVELTVAICNLGMRVTQYEKENRL
jgi:histone H3/H4